MATQFARRTTWIALVSVALLTLLAPAASAQSDDPYGSTSSTAPPPSGAVSCNVEPSQGSPGTNVTATVDGVDFGSQIQINFGGEVVAGTTAPSAFQSGTTAVELSFAVPDRAPGDYVVTAVGPDFTVTCGPDVEGVFAVLAASESTTGDGGSGPLAFTGANLLVLVVAGLVALTVGVALVRRSQNRKQYA